MPCGSLERRMISKRGGLVGGWRAHRFKGCGQVCRERSLGIGRKLLIVAGEVENVDGGFAFRVDKSHFDVALMRAEREGNLAKQAGDILCDNLQQRRVSR